MKQYDYLIVGAGFYGSICAHELTKQGFKCLVVDKRYHIGGNCYTSNRDGINVHEYGPHIFHTSNKQVWEWINQFVEFNNFRLSPVAYHDDKLYSLPFNMWTFYQILGCKTPDEVLEAIKKDSEGIPDEPDNLEDQAIKLVGRKVYNTLIKGYTEKQWRRSARRLPASIIKRLPVRLTFDSNYFTDTYQGIPIGGYTQIFEKLLDGIEVRLGTEYLKHREELDGLATNIIYTGPIDALFNYQFGSLEYKTTEFITTKIDKENFQGAPVVNFTERDMPQTRVIEHKHFENSKSNCTWVTLETPKNYIAGVSEPMYPVNDTENNKRYEQYKSLADSIPNLHLGGRLAEYKYYDMHQVIESALNFIDHETRRPDHSCDTNV